MTGFIRGLFGRRNEEANQSEYFLDADSAKTLGDVKYMRKPKKVRHTFPTGAELVEEVSSIEKRELTAETNSSNSSNSSTPPVAFEPPKTVTGSSATEKSSTNMDLFRKLAKDIKRR